MGLGHDDTASNCMSVLLLGVTGNRHARAEKRNMPKVGERYTGAGIHAEDLHTGKRRDDADPEAEHVRDGGDCDGDSGVTVARRHPFGNRIMN